MPYTVDTGNDSNIIPYHILKTLSQGMKRKLEVPKIALLHYKIQQNDTSIISNLQHNN